MGDNFASKRLHIDHDTGNLHIPGKDPLPLVGPTTGPQYEELKKKEQAARIQMNRLERVMRSIWQCTECKWKGPGGIEKDGKWVRSTIRTVWRKTEGVDMEVLVCPNPKCDGPVVMVQDALDLTRAPGGKV